MLSDGLHDVPPGRIAAVVTHLEMVTRPEIGPAPLPRPDLRLDRIENPDPEAYLALFRKVGEDWLWFSRLIQPRDDLARILRHPGVEVYHLMAGDQPEGLLELDFRETGACELTYFGLAPALTGGGIGRWMMNRAIARAFANPIRRFHVHTCTLDSPAALPFYIRAGFTPRRQQIEIAPDPRLSGALPRRAAPQVPIVKDIV